MFEDVGVRQPGVRLEISGQHGCCRGRGCGIGKWERASLGAVVTDISPPLSYRFHRNRAVIWILSFLGAPMPRLA